MSRNISSIDSTTRPSNCDPVVHSQWHSGTDTLWTGYSTSTRVRLSILRMSHRAHKDTDWHVHDCTFHTCLLAVVAWGNERSWPVLFRLSAPGSVIELGWRNGNRQVRCVGIVRQNRPSMECEDQRDGIWAIQRSQWRCQLCRILQTAIEWYRALIIKQFDSGNLVHAKTDQR